MPATSAKTASSERTDALEYLQRIAALEKQVERTTTRAVLAERRVAELEDKLAFANSNATNSAVVPIDGFYNFIEFRAAVFASLGRDDRWQSEYCEQTGVNLSKIQQWRKSGKVPAVNYDMATNLVAPKSEGSKPRQSWTTADYERMETLLNGPDSPNYKTVAAILSTEWGRNITENAIKGAVNRRKRN